MIIAVTGGRDYDNWANAWSALLPHAVLGNVLINGGARGADKICHKIWTRDFQLPSITVPAGWERMGKAAGMARNHAMAVGNSIAPHAVLKPDLLLRFPGGPGSAGMESECRREDIEVIQCA